MNDIPEGARIQLNPERDLNTLTLTPTERTIAAARQEYGMFLGDIGGGIQLYAIHPNSVDSDPYAGLFTEDTVEDGDRFPGAFVFLNNIPVEEFRVLTLGPQDPDVNEEVVPNGCVEFE